MNTRRLLGKLPAAAFLAALYLAGAACSTRVLRDPLSFETMNVHSVPGRPAVLAPSAATCRPLVEKRIVYGLFVLPFNEIEPARLKELEGRTVRLREEMRPSDVVISLFGFLFSILARTRVIEECPGDFAAVAAAELKKLQAEAGQAEELRRENERLRAEMGKGPAAKEEPEGSVKKRSAPASSVPSISVNLGEARDPKEQARQVILFSLRSSQLDGAARAKLDELAGRLAALPTETRVLVIAHTEDADRLRSRLPLAFRRSLNVIDYLASKGVARSRMLAASAETRVWPYPEAQEAVSPTFRTVSVILLR